MTGFARGLLRTIPLAAAIAAGIAPALHGTAQVQEVEGTAGRAAADPASGYAAIAALASDNPAARQSAAAKLLATGDCGWVPPLVDQLFFVPTRHRGDILRLLAGLTGERRERYLEWVAYVGEHPEIAPPPGYLGWKGALLARIHPRFRELLRDGAPLRIRAEEIVSGGVPFDGIPSLERPPHLAAAAAATLADGEQVFAAEVGGEARAWPLAVLSWHEMLNDRLGGEPVTLSFCTLCRSAVLYRGRLPTGEETTFGTSGLLYRSNKLMFDRRTRTLWSNLTGEPVLGPLATGAPPHGLEVLPLVLTSWGAWRALHPRTTVLVGDPQVARRHGYDYTPGAADRRRAGVSFPVPRLDSRLAPDDEVWGLRLSGRAKAFALRPLLGAGVLNDAVGGDPVVLVADAASGAIRAYRRGGQRFRHGNTGELLDESGARWQMGEDALRPLAPAGSSDAAAAAPLPRLPGFPSYWFGWQAFYPGGELWTGADPPPAATTP